MTLMEEDKTGDSIGQMLSVREVAKLLHVHTNTLRRWSDQGLIRAYRINARGDRRYAREDITKFVVQLNASIHPVGQVTLGQMSNSWGRMVTQV